MKSAAKLYRVYPWEGTAMEERTETFYRECNGFEIVIHTNHCANGRPLQRGCPYSAEYLSPTLYDTYLALEKPFLSSE